MILITGANGQLGHAFKKLFTKDNIKFITTDIDSLDITKKDDVREYVKVKKISIIINCAAYNDVDKAEVEKEKCFLINAYAPQIIAEVAKEFDADFITYSSDFVFDGKKKVPYTEEDEPNPLSTYACSKREGEVNVLKTYNKSFVIRTSWLFGVGNKNFNTQVINWAKNNKVLKIVDDQISSPTYASDLAYFSWKLYKTKKYGLYHFSNDKEASKYDQAKYALSKIGWDGEILPAKSTDFDLPAKRPAYSKLDSSKLEKTVCEKIPSWQSGIDRYLKEMEDMNEI